MYEIANFPQRRNQIIRNIFLTAGIILIADTLALRFTSNWNLGIVLPAILGMPLLIYGIFKYKLDIWFKTKAGRIVKLIFIAGYCVFLAIFVIGCVFIINGAKTSTEDKADAIIVLGAGIRGDEPSYSLENRLDAAADYYHMNATEDTLIVVSGGYGNNEKYSEAYVMAKYLIEEKNIPKNKIILEDKSKSTKENFKYSKSILDKKLGKNYKIAYVTNDFHIYRSGLYAEKEGLNAFGISAPTPLLIVPNCYVRESLALFKEAVFGD